MVVNFYQGPGRNLEFCLITTGLNVDPNHGCWSRELYKHIKTVIQEKAEIHFENRTIREVFDTDASSFLPAYSSTPRTVYQFLFGLVEHNNGWTESTLYQAFDTQPLSQSLKPKDGEFSIDFVESQENGFKLFFNQLVGLSNLWVEKQEFYYSSCEPEIQDGDSGDVWLVSDGSDKFELWYKPAFKWVRLFDFVGDQSPPGTLHFQTSTPANSTNSWWLDLTGLVIRKFNASINTWEAAPPLTVSPTAPGSPSDGDLWIRIVKGNFQLFEYVSSLGKFVRRKFSNNPVHLRSTNSTLVGTSGSNNYVLDCGEEALLGGPITQGAGELEIRKDGVTIATLVDCLNFKGPDLSVTDAGTCVDIEHLPITTLPEQGGAPASLTDAGKLFTLEIGGRTELFYIDDSGNVTQLTNNGVTTQNVFLAVATASAIAGQTMFTLPGTAKAVLSVKVNGVDTTAWSFTPPTVTYFPGPGGYVIQSGDVITVLYYG